MLQGDLEKNVFIEFELSEEYIIMTLSQGRKKGVKRIALVGDFQYKDDDLDRGSSSGRPMMISTQKGKQIQAGGTTVKHGHRRTAKELKYKTQIMDHHLDWP